VADQGQDAGSGIAHRRRGQPLVFLLTVLCAWSAARVIHHWPVIDPTPTASVPVRMTSQGQADAAPQLRASAHQRALSADDPLRALHLVHGAGGAKPRAGSAGSVIGPPGWQAQAQDAERAFLPLRPAPPRPADKVPLSPVPEAWLPPAPSGADGSRAHAGRWSVYGWSLVRQGSSDSILAPGGQYGGSQAGLVVRWAMGDAPHRPALYARATGALASSDDRTLALGLSVRPMARLPFDLAVERRIALVEGQRDRWALLAVAGGDRAVGRSGAQLSVYGQAGLVGLAQSHAFFDLQASLTQPVLKRGGTTLALGGGLWAGGQQEPDGQGDKPWLHRMDLGPRAMLTVPVERGALTFALDWRQRIDGQARPSSGVALTLSAGF
jgi:hypothetical protein|tara:strand:- start:19141 stop:20286 length:1146 start_codon:yes stop_codon:yes gene_type:complete